MITGLRRALLWVALGVLMLAPLACQRVALLAPGGSTITLTSLATTLPFSGTTSLIAQVIEPADLKTKNDGNNVSLDRESRLLSENALRFQLAAQLLKSQVRAVRSAIQEGKS